MNNSLKLFDKFIRTNKKCWTTPGISITIFDSDKILYSHVSGYADLEKKRKLTITDKFCIASCFKSYLCAAITIMIHKKIIPNIWDMRLGKLWTNVHPKFKDVKLKLLSMHRSGIIDMHGCPNKYKQLLKKYGNIDGVKSRRQITDMYLKNPPAYEPGSEFRYSNVGFGILGAIVEKISNMTYSQIVDKFIMNELKIDAVYDQHCVGDGFAMGHDYNIFQQNAKYQVLKRGQHIKPAFEAPAGDCYISILDSTKYLQQYLKAFKNKKSIFTKAIANELTIASVTDKYCYGWGGIVSSFSHSGMYFATTTDYFVNKKHNIGYVLEGNAYTLPIEMIQNKFRELFM